MCTYICTYVQFTILVVIGARTVAVLQGTPEPLWQMPPVAAAAMSDVGGWELLCKVRPIVSCPNIRFQYGIYLKAYRDP